MNTLTSIELRKVLLNKGKLCAMIDLLLMREIQSAITFACVVMCAVWIATLLLIIIAHWSLLRACPMSDDMQPFFPQASEAVLST